MSADGVYSMEATIEKPAAVESVFAVVKSLHVAHWLAIIVTGSACLLAGFESSIISFPKDVFAKVHGVSTTSTVYPWLAAINPLGAAIGCLPIVSGAAADYLGRKAALCATLVLYLLAVVLTCLAPSVGAFLAGRWFSGIAIGAICTISPVYLAEVSPPRLRAGITALTQVFIVTGVLLGFVISRPFMLATTKVWDAPFACFTPLAGLLLCVVPFAPASPRWLLAKGKQEQARASLLRLRGLKADCTDQAVLAEVEAEVRSIEAGIASAAAAAGAVATADGTSTVFSWRVSLHQLTRPAVLQAMAISFVLGMFQQLSGMAAINKYSSVIFGSGGAGFSPVAAIDAVIYLSIVKTIAVILGEAFLMDHFGRRTLLLWGSAGMTACLLSVGGILKGTHGNATGANSSAALAMLIGYVIFYEISVGPLLWVLSAELFPTSIRGMSMSAGSTSCWLFTFAVSYFFPDLVKSAGLDGAFFFFSGWTTACLLWAAVIIPETRGMSLEHIQAMLQGRQKLGWGALFSKTTATGEEASESISSGVETPNPAVVTNFKAASDVEAGLSLTNPMLAAQDGLQMRPSAAVEAAAGQAGDDPCNTATSTPMPAPTATPQVVL